MLDKVRTKIEQQLKRFIQKIDQTYSLSKISSLLFRSIKEFMLREGKRIRPLLFCVGYLGFAKKTAPNLYTSALSWELMHDFLLVHDDIIDKSDIRRGKPSMHNMLNGYLKKYKNLKFNGQDLSIVVGDVMYAMAIHSFLSIKEDSSRKEKALKKFIEAVIYTGSGEFIELLYAKEDLAKIKKEQIYKIYDFKTSYYSFSSPLSTGAILAGASQREVDRLFKFGIYLGRSFQIQDDILGLFSEEKIIGKSILSDLKEAKKTLLIWYAYNNSTLKDKLTMRKIFKKAEIRKSDLLKIRRIVAKCGALDYAKSEIARFMKAAENIIASSGIRPQYQKFLISYSGEILKL